MKTLRKNVCQSQWDVTWRTPCPAWLDRVLAFDKANLEGKLTLTNATFDLWSGKYCWSSIAWSGTSGMKFKEKWAEEENKEKREGEMRWRQLVIPLQCNGKPPAVPPILVFSNTAIGFCPEHTLSPPTDKDWAPIVDCNDNWPAAFRRVNFAVRCTCSVVFFSYQVQWSG